jgi:salicylate hydroxylase
MSTPGSAKQVLIAGGGIGGLAAALALLKRGFDVDVYEQAQEQREVGAGVQLSANGIRVLHELGVHEALRALACEAAGKEVRLWNTGQTWKLFDLGAQSVERYGFPYYLVYRPDLLAVLADGVRREKPDAIHLGARCTGFEQSARGVTLRFEGGEARGDVLIGADGVHSRIREALFGPDRPGRTTKVVLGSTENICRFQDRTMADPAAAQAYVDREWAEERVKSRYGWLFTYDVTSVVV